MRQVVNADAFAVCLFYSLCKGPLPTPPSPNSMIAFYTSQLWFYSNYADAFGKLPMRSMRRTSILSSLQTWEKAAIFARCSSPPAVNLPAGRHDRLQCVLKMEKCVHIVSKLCSALSSASSLPMAQFSLSCTDLCQNELPTSSVWKQGKKKGFAESHK